MDRVSASVRSANMRAIRAGGMKPEVAVRKLVHKLGYRFRLHRHDLPGRPDMVFAGRKKVIFINGCFWHQHDVAGCRSARVPHSNRAYWGPKLARTVARDKWVRAELSALGWRHLTIWECELAIGGEERLAGKVARFLER